MKRKAEQRISKALILLICTGLILVIAVTVWVNMNSVRSIRNLVRSTTTENITELTVSKAQYLDEKIHSEMLALQSLSSSLGEGKDVLSCQNLLKEYKDRRKASCIWVSDMEGNYLNTGCHEDILQEKRELFEGALRGEEGISDVFLGELGRRQVLFQTPVYQNGQVVGGVYEAYPVESLQNAYGGSTYSDAGYSYVLDSSGSIVLAPLRFSYLQIYDNIRDVLKDGGNKTEAVNQFIEALQSGAKGSAVFDFEEEPQFLSFIPLQEKEGWYFVTVIPLSMVEKDGTAIVGMTAHMGAAIVIAVVFSLSVLFAFVLYRNKKARDYDDYIRNIYQAIAQNIDTVIFIVDARTLRVEYAFENAETVLGIMPQAFSEPDRKNESEFYKAFSNILTERLTDKLMKVFPIYNDLLDKQMWLKITALPVNLMGDTKYIFAATDVTQEQQIQENLNAAVAAAENANASKSMFLSNMSHDIRTPMNAIVGMTKLAEANMEDRVKVEDCLHKIDISSKHLLNLINDVLDMSKIESGKMTLTSEPFSLAELIQGDCAILQPQCRSRQQTFEVETRNVRHEYLVGDAMRLNQVFLNLLSNASKFTSASGKILFTIRELPQRDSRFAAFRFEVADTGVGISEEFLTRIFVPFERESNSRQNQIEGTGLGLVIAKNIIEAMGGQISIKSNIGQGTVFTIEAEIQIAQEDAEGSCDLEVLEGLKVLAVDSRPEEGAFILNNLKGYGMSAEHVLTGEDAVKYAQNKPCDLIVMERDIPGMGGMEAVRQIRDVAGNAPKILFVVPSDCADSSSFDGEGKPDAVIQRPIFKSTLYQKIASLFGKQDGDNRKHASQKIFSGRRFLLVEDNELNREIASQLLELAGAAVECAMDGKAGAEAFEEKEENYYDAIFMDIQMPVMNGYEAAKHIRASAHPQAKSIPIVAMSANAFSEDVRTALESGMNAHVGKPIDMDTLANVLAGLL